MNQPGSNRDFRKALWYVLLACLAGYAPSVRAILSGSVYNYSDPVTPPWNYVGSISAASGVYLGDFGGNNWVLTAGHVGLGDFTLGNTTYAAISGSAFGITNADGSPADLSLFRISGTPGLANLSIVSGAPANGSTVQMIGFGGGKSWGTNTIFGYSEYSLEGMPFGGMGIVTLASGMGGNGGQGVPGDSGGGMFYQTAGGTWALAGILSGVGDFMTSGGVDLGEGTVAVDLAAYSGQIASDINSVAIPEPSVYSVMAGAATLGFAVMRRKRAQAPT